MLDNALGIASALAVILSGLAIFVFVAQRRKNAIEHEGFVRAATGDGALASLTKSLFDAAPIEIHEKEDKSGRSWLAFVDTGDSEASGCALLVFPLEGHDGRTLVLIRSGRRIPAAFLRLQGGLFDWTMPLDDSETSPLTGTGWFAYGPPDQQQPSSFTERVFRAVHVPGSNRLLGIAVVDAYLAVWTDADRIKTLLATAPLVRSAIQMENA